MTHGIRTTPDQPTPTHDDGTPTQQTRRARTLRDVTVIPADRPGIEPMTDTERQQWAALEEGFLSGLEQSRANSAARCTRANCACPAVSA